MKALFGFLLPLILFTAAALWLTSQPGEAHIVWHDYVIDSSAAALAIGTIALGYVFYLLFRLFRFAAHGPAYWRLTRKMTRLRQGHETLTQGLIAVAAGHAAEAGRCAVAARKTLGNSTLSQLLQAQAAQLAGDDRAAQLLFRQLADQPSSIVLGYRGLIMIARRAGNWKELERLADSLYRLKPDTPWLGLVRFDLLVQRQEWNEANLMLAQVATARLLAPHMIKHQRAALLVAASQDASSAGQKNLALQYAERAMKQGLNWLPAIINLAERQRDAGHLRAARRTVEKYWPLLPHRQLALACHAAGTDTLEIYKAVEKLCHGLDDIVTVSLKAETALDAELWGEARRHLTGLISRGGATQKIYRLMARLERRETGDERAMLHWLVKAAEAAPDDTWLCTDCGGAHDDWHATCAHCRSFNTLDWRRPGTAKPTENNLARLQKHEIQRVGWQDVIAP